MIMMIRWQAIAMEQSSASQWPPLGRAQNSLQRIPARCELAPGVLSWFAGEKNAGQPGSLAGPTVLALGCLVLASQLDARMGWLQPPVPQVQCKVSLAYGNVIVFWKHRKNPECHYRLELVTQFRKQCIQASHLLFEQHRNSYWKALGPETAHVIHIFYGLFICLGCSPYTAFSAKRRRKGG